MENELEIMSYTDNFTEGCSKKQAPNIIQLKIPWSKTSRKHHREGSKPMLAVKDSPRGPKRRKESGDRSSWGKGS